MSDTCLKKHSLTLAGHRTSLTLEDAFWVVLKKIAQEKELPLNKLIEEIDKKRTTNLSSAVRVFILKSLLSQEERRDSL